MSNQEVYDAVSSEVRKRFFRDNNYIMYGTLEKNYFSFCIGAEIHSQGVRRGFYVKIPKADLYIEGLSTIMPISERDRCLARDEYESLTYLYRNWDAHDLRIFSPWPIGFLKEYNAIVTERFYAGEIFHLFRYQDIKLRTIGAKNNSMIGYMRRLGSAIARFHRKNVTEVDVDLTPLISKVEGLISRLDLLGADAKLMERIGIILPTIRSVKLRSSYTKTLKGLDIRNIFVNKDGDLFLLDPGKMKEDWCEMDLARFLVTCRILYWGSLIFFLRLSPEKVYEEQFIEAYYADRKIPKELLHLCMIKELLKHWNMAYVVLSLKSWPDNVKALIKRFYIDPFYKKQISMEMEQLV